MTIVYRVGDGLYVNITNRCPCACEFCIRKNAAGVYGSDPLWLEREPTVGEICAAIASAEKMYQSVVFCGYGEPTERLDVLLDVAKFIRRTMPGMPIRVNTNGLSDLIAGHETTKEFAGLIDAVSISLNAENADRYAAICHPKFGAEAYPAMLKFAKGIKAYVPSVTMTIVGTPDMTPERIAACKRIVDDVGVNFRVRTYSAHLSNPNEQMARVNEAWSEIKKERGIK